MVRSLLPGKTQEKALFRKFLPIDLKVALPASPDDQDQPPEAGDLAQRLEEAKRRNAPTPVSSPTGVDDSMGVGMRSGVEFVAALLVSVGIGLGLDRWLHTAPILLLVMLVLGFCAGLLNVYRAMNGMSYGATYKPKPGQKNPAPKDEPDRP